MKFVLQFIIPLQISYIFPSAFSNSPASLIYWETWQRFPVHLSLLDYLVSPLGIFALSRLNSTALHQPLMGGLSPKTVLYSFAGVRDVPR